MNSFTFLKEHRLMFFAGPDTPNPSTELPDFNSPDALASFEDNDRVDPPEAQAAAEQVAADVRDGAQGIINQLPGGASAPASPEAVADSAPTDEAVASAIDNSSEITDVTGERTAEVTEKLNGLSQKINAVLNNPDFKAAMQSLAATLRTFMQELKGVFGYKTGAETTDKVRNEASKEVSQEGNRQSNESGSESQESTESTPENPQARLKEELEAHAAENSSNNVDTLIAKKEAEKAEALPDIEAKINDLESQRDEVKAGLDDMENTLHDLQVAKKRADDPEAKDDLDAQIRMLEADITSEQEKLRILDEEIDEEIAKEDEVNNTLDADIDALKQMKEVAEATAEGINQTISAMRQTTDNTDVLAVLNSMEATVSRTLDVEITVDEAALSTLSEQVGIEPFAGIENGVTTDADGLIAHLEKIFAALEDSEDGDEDTEQTPESNEELMEDWSKQIEGRAEELGYTTLEFDVVQVEEGHFELAISGSPEEIAKLLPHAAERGMTPELDRTSPDSHTLHLHITEKLGGIGFVGPESTLDETFQNLESAFDAREEGGETLEEPDTTEPGVEERIPTPAEGDSEEGTDTFGDETEPINPEAEGNGDNENPQNPVLREDIEVLNEEDFERSLDEIERETLKLKMAEANNEAIDSATVNNLLTKLRKLEGVLEGQYDINDPYRGSEYRPAIAFTVPQETQDFLNTANEKDWDQRLKDVKEDLEDLVKHSVSEVQPENLDSLPPETSGNGSETVETTETEQKIARVKELYQMLVNAEASSPGAAEQLMGELNDAVAELGDAVYDDAVLSELLLSQAFQDGSEVGFDAATKQFVRSEPALPTETPNPETTERLAENLQEIQNRLEQIADQFVNDEPGLAQIRLDEFNQELADMNLTEDEMAQVQNMMVLNLPAPQSGVEQDLFYNDIDSKFVFDDSVDSSNIPMVDTTPDAPDIAMNVDTDTLNSNPSV